MPVVMPMRRPNAMSSSGTLCTPQTDSATNPTATPADNSRACVRATRISGISTRRPPSADATSRTRSVFCVPIGRDQNEAHHQRAENRAGGVRGVDAADRGAGIAAARSGRGEGEGEARAPEQRRREDRPDRARHVDLEGENRVFRKLRIDRPIGERIGDGIGRPGDSGGGQHLAPAEREARIDARAPCPTPRRCRWRGPPGTPQG